MVRRLTDNESNEVLLRTTTDVLAHALVQAEVCASKWPEYASDVNSFREFVERIVVHAKEVGYVEKTRI